MKQSVKVLALKHIELMQLIPQILFVVNVIKIVKLVQDKMNMIVLLV